MCLVGCYSHIQPAFAVNETLVEDAFSDIHLCTYLVVYVNKEPMTLSWQGPKLSGEMSELNYLRERWRRMSASLTRSVCWKSLRNMALAVSY